MNIVVDIGRLRTLGVVLDKLFDRPLARCRDLQLSLVPVDQSFELIEARLRQTRRLLTKQMIELRKIAVPERRDEPKIAIRHIAR